MYTEYEATFTNRKPDEVRVVLKTAGAELVKPEFLQKRIAFTLPRADADKDTWLRVRDEGDTLTMSFKSVHGDEIDNQQEICLGIDNFENAALFLEAIGCRRKAYQETKRELWILNNVEVTIDIWPFLEPFVEVEGKSEADVQSVSKKLGFNWEEARFCSVDTLYAEKYSVPEAVINDHTPEIIFDMKNPFLS